MGFHTLKTGDSRINYVVGDCRAAKAEVGIADNGGKWAYVLTPTTAKYIKSGHKMLPPG